MSAASSTVRAIGPWCHKVAAGECGLHRHNAKRRLETEYTAESRGDADRAAAVGADVQGAQTKRGSNGRAAAAAARSKLAVPGVDRDPGQWTVGHAFPAEL